MNDFSPMHFHSLIGLAQLNTSQSPSVILAVLDNENLQ